MAIDNSIKPEIAPGSNAKDAEISQWIDQWLSNIKGNSERKTALIEHLDRKGSKARRSIKGEARWGPREIVDFTRDKLRLLSKKRRGESLYSWFIGVVESNLAPYCSSSVVPGLDSGGFSPYDLFSLEWTTDDLGVDNPGRHEEDSLSSCKSKVLMQTDVWHTMDKATQHKFIIHELGHWWDWLVGCLSHSEGHALNEDKEGWMLNEDGAVRWTSEPAGYASVQLKNESTLSGAIYSDTGLWERIVENFGFDGAIERGLDDYDFVDGVTITDPAWLKEDWRENSQESANAQIEGSYLSMNLANCRDFLPTSSSHARNPPEMYAFVAHEWLRGSAMEEEHFVALKAAKDYLNKINWEEATCNQARKAREVADEITTLNGAPFRFTALLFLNTDVEWTRFSGWVNGLSKLQKGHSTSETEPYNPEGGEATASSQRKNLVRLANTLDDMGLITEADKIDSLIKRSDGFDGGVER